MVQRSLAKTVTVPLKETFGFMQERYNWKLTLFKNNRGGGNLIYVESSSMESKRDTADATRPTI